MSTTTSTGSVPSQPSAPPGESAPSPAATRTPTRTARVQDAIHAGACVLCGVLVTLGFALNPAADADTGTALRDQVADTPEAFYWGTVLAAFGLVLLAAVGLAVMRLVRGRGRVLATIGGMLLVVGGAGAAAGTFMYGAVVTAMVESGEDPEAVARLLDHLEDSSRTGLAFMAGFPSFALGVVVCIAALVVSRAVARWIPAALGLGLIGVFVLGDGDLHSVADVVLAAGLAGIGVTLLRRTAERAA